MILIGARYRSIIVCMPFVFVIGMSTSGRIMAAVKGSWMVGYSVTFIHSLFRTLNGTGRKQTETVTKSLIRIQENLIGYGRSHLPLSIDFMSIFCHFWWFLKVLQCPSLQRTPVFKKCQKFGKNLKKTLVQKLTNESRLLIHNGFVKRRQVNSAYGYKQVLYMYMVWLNSTAS